MDRPILPPADWLAARRVQGGCYGPPAGPRQLADLRQRLAAQDGLALPADIAALLAEADGLATGKFALFGTAPLTGADGRVLAGELSSQQGRFADLGAPTERLVLGRHGGELLTAEADGGFALLDGGSGEVLEAAPDLPGLLARLRV